MKINTLAGECNELQKRQEEQKRQNQSLFALFALLAFFAVNDFSHRVPQLRKSVLTSARIGRILGFSGATARAEFRDLHDDNWAENCQTDDAPVRGIRRYGLQHARERRIPDREQLQRNHDGCRAPDISVREKPGQR